MSGNAGGGVRASRPSVKVARDERGVATVWLDNPGRKNALTPAMCHDLVACMAELDRDPSVRVVVLRGRDGDFSAGAAIDDVENVLYAERSAESAVGEDLLTAADEAISAVRCPVIAAVEGICMGGAWQVAAAADIILASTTARLAITPAKLGIVYPRRGLERLVRHVGADRAKYILFLAEEISVHDAHTWGLVTTTVPAETFDDEVLRVADLIQTRSQYSSVHHKALIDAYVSPPSRGGRYDQEWARAWAGALESADLPEGRRAFLDKRMPEFRWTRDRDVQRPGVEMS